MVQTRVPYLHPPGSFQAPWILRIASSRFGEDRAGYLLASGPVSEKRVCSARNGRDDARVVEVGRASGHPEVMFRYGSGNFCGRILRELLVMSFCEAAGL